MGFVSDFVEGLFGGSSDAEETASDATDTAVAGQREALNYLKEREAIPQQFREQALKRLGGIAGLPGGRGDQRQLIARAKRSPLYSAIMGGQKEGEESILRNAAATGGLRSGNVQQALYDTNVELENKALLESYNQQLQGLQALSQQPTNTNQIAEGIAGIGATQAQGITAQGQIRQQGFQNASGMIGPAIDIGSQLLSLVI